MVEKAVSSPALRDSRTVEPLEPRRDGRAMDNRNHRVGPVTSAPTTLSQEIPARPVELRPGLLLHEEIRLRTHIDFVGRHRFRGYGMQLLRFW